MTLIALCGRCHIRSMFVRRKHMHGLCSVVSEASEKRSGVFDRNGGEMILRF